MSKYTDAELKQMAQVALQARESGDPRYTLLIIELSIVTGVNTHECELRILEMATIAEAA